MQAYLEQILCNYCTSLSILICILQTRVDFAVKHRGTPCKWNLTYFKGKNKCYNRLELEKQMKNMIFCLVGSILLGITVLKILKLVCFSKFLCWWQRKLWSTGAIFCNASERSLSLCALSGPDQLLWGY